ncbi:MAG: MFS transporter [Rubrivivax sp.]
MTRIFIGFACAYFLSALLRAVTATLAPAFSAELALQAADLGLLAGVYFFGFAALQLPLGHALDRFGPRRVLLALMTLAVAGCLAFAAARSLPGLLAARMMIGMGVAACLMAPLTSYRRRFSPAAQLRANSWMLMTGSLGMVASTLPVQWALPLIGWRGLFVLLAAALVAAMCLLWWLVPADPPITVAGERGADAAASGGYAAILRHPLFVRLAPLAVMQYGGLIAVQALWAGPWLTEVAGRTPAQAAAGLFGINLSMLLAFLAWGALMPRLAARGLTALAVLRRGMPWVLAVLAGIIWVGPAAGAGAWAAWAAWCVASTCVSLSQPAVGQAFPAAQAGRALSAYNLLIFAGVFGVQWGIGLALDAARAAGLDTVAAFRVTFSGFGLACGAAYAWFLWRGRA